MEIIIKAEKEITKIIVDDKDVKKLVNAIYWFMKDNYIKPKIEYTAL